MLICLNFWYPFGPFFHVTLVGGDDGIVLTMWFFGMLVRFSGFSCLMFIGAVSCSLNFLYPFGPFIHVTLAGEDDTMVLTKWFFGILVSFSGPSWLMFNTLLPFSISSWVLLEHSHVTLVGGDDALVLTKLFFVMPVYLSGASWLILLGRVSTFYLNQMESQITFNCVKSLVVTVTDTITLIDFSAV